jgi:hypothetical protein
MTLLGVLKRRPRCELLFEEEKVIVKLIMKIYLDFKHTTVNSNVWKAFQAFAFEFDIRSELYRFLFNEEKLNKSAVQTSESCGRLASP